MHFTPRQRRCLTVCIDGFPAGLPAGRVPLPAEVSAAGLTFESAQPLAEGTPLQGTLALDGEAFPFAGEVSWARAGDARLSLRGRVGVRFTDAPDALWARLG
jgi:PilZ domain